MSSNAWKPQHGEVVTAVLFDEHEVDGIYLSSADRHGVVVHRVGMPDNTVVESTRVLPEPPAEPTEFGARIIDGAGEPWVMIANDREYRWTSRACLTRWSDIARPITVVDADPEWWNDPR